MNWTEGKQIWNWLLIFYFRYYFCLNFISFCTYFVFLFVLIWVYFFVYQELWLFYVHFFSLIFFLVKYLILLMFCFIMYWPTENSDIIRLYIYKPGEHRQQSKGEKHTKLRAQWVRPNANEAIYVWNCCNAPAVFGRG